MLNSQRFQIVSLEEASNANVRLEVDFLVFVESASCLRSGFEEILTQSLPSPDSLVLAYGDETISLANRRIRTWKPTWSPERLRGQYFVGLPVILKYCFAIFQALSTASPPPVVKNTLLRFLGA